MNMLNYIFASCPFKLLKKPPFFLIPLGYSFFKSFWMLPWEVCLVFLIPKHYFDYIILIDIFLNYLEDPQNDDVIQQLYCPFPKNDMSMYSLILFGCVSNNLTNFPGAGISPVDRDYGISSRECVFNAGVVFVTFPSCVETALHRVRKAVGMTLPDCLPRKDQHWVEAETSHLSQSAFSSCSSLGYGGAVTTFSVPIWGFVTAPGKRCIYRDTESQNALGWKGP